MATTTSPATDLLLRRLAETAALPLRRAQTLPREIYFDPEIYAIEVERIFRREWMCVARADQIAKPGDFLSVDLVGEPLLLTRDQAGTLHALSRVCRHRYMDLLGLSETKAGNANRIVCPYHLWSYKLDGRLAGAPAMEEAEGFERSECRLPEFPLEVWQGFVFVNLDREAPPLAPRLYEIERVIRRDMSDWQTVATVDWGDVDVNWKLAIENGSECYHHMGTHRDTLQPIWPATSVTVDHVDSADWFYGTMTVSEQFSLGRADRYPIHPTFFPVPEGLTAEQRSATLIAAMFPMFFFALSPDFCSWFRWFPTGPASHFVEIHIIVPPSTASLPDLDERVAQVVEAVRGIQAEDAATNASVQRGCHASAVTPGRLSKLEQPLWQFQRYLANRLTGAQL